MKKSIVLGLAVVMGLAASVTTFASVYDSHTESNQPEGISVEATSHGHGRCRHASCWCTHYVRATGGAGKCICGHWDYIHN